MRNETKSNRWFNMYHPWERKLYRAIYRRIIYLLWKWFLENNMNKHKWIKDKTVQNTIKELIQELQENKQNAFIDILQKSLQIEWKWGWKIRRHILQTIKFIIEQIINNQQYSSDRINQITEWVKVLLIQYLKKETK